MIRHWKGKWTMTKKLPIAGRQTTASKTDFVYERIDGPGGLHLFIDGNQKVSGWNPKPNAFSLPQIESCPGSTPTCREGCYVHNLEKAQPELHAMYQHNFETIQEILRTGYDDSKVSLSGSWMRTLAHWISQNCKDTGFRWHVSGDLFSDDYGRFISDVTLASLGVKHWIYTRSISLIPSLDGFGRLAVNISADLDNYPDAYSFLLLDQESAGFASRICYYTKDGHVPADLPEGSVIFPDYSLRGNTEWRDSLPENQRKMLCPVDMYGKSERNRCGPCRKCIDP